MTLVIPKALIWVLGALLVVGISAAAFTAGTMLGSPAGATASPTIAASSPSSAASPTPTSTPTATPTTAPTASPTTAPTTVPTVAPTPVRTATPTPVPTPLTFTSAQGGGATTSGKHTGLFGLVLADATAAYNAQNRRMTVAAAIPTIGSLEKPSGRAWLYNDFRAPAGGNVQAQIAGSIRWQGVLAGNGAAGAGAAIKVEVKVLDGSTLVASQTVHSKEVRESAMTVGGTDDVDEENFSFNANLQAGRLYRLQVEATCNAYTGLLGTVTHCVFGASDVYKDGFVEWTALSVRF